MDGKYSFEEFNQNLEERELVRTIADIYYLKHQKTATHKNY